MKIGNKIMVAGGALVSFILIFQGVISQTTIKMELKKESINRLNEEAVQRIAQLHEFISMADRETITIQSHNAFENLFTSTSDTNTASSHSLDELRGYFRRIKENRPQYAKLQITTSSGKFLLKDGPGKNSEQAIDQKQLEKFKQQLVHSNIKGATAEKERIISLIMLDDNSEWHLISASPIYVNDKMMGVLWINRYIGDYLTKIFDDLSNSKMYYALFSDTGQTIVNTDGLSVRKLTGLIKKDLPGTLISSKQIPDLGLTLSLGIDKSKAYAVLNDLFMLGIAVLVLSVFLSMAILGVIARRISHPINQLINSAKGLSSGNLSMEEIEVTGDEIGVLNAAYLQVVSYFRELVSICQSIADGDFNRSIVVKSENDALGKSVNKMIAKLKTATDENRHQNRLKTGIAELNHEMRGEQDIENLARNVITCMARFLNMPVGAVYLANEEGMFQFIAGHALSTKENLPAVIMPGEGIVGEVAREKNILYLDGAPDKYLKVYSGLGNAQPTKIVAAPLIFEGEVKGVIELASFQEIGEVEKEFIGMVLESIAISVNAAQSRARINDLLAKSTLQAEELTIQQVELQQVNEELEEQTQALEQQKDELTQKNVELEKAQKVVQETVTQLEQSNKYKSDFLANMSHELRTPLNSLLILSKLLTENKEKTLSDKQVEYAKTINQAGGDLLSLINEILDLAKIEAGRMELHCDQVYIEDFLGNTERNFLHFAQNKGLSLTVEKSDDIPEIINTDRQRLDQIIKNFLSNAFKFTSKGGVAVSVHRPDKTVDLTRSGLDCLSAIAVSVTDTGIGIPEDKHKQIFEAFRQVDGSTSRQYGGTGLGLTISLNLAKLLGGEIQMKSASGKGSTFTIYLPADAVTTESEKPKRHDEAPEVVKSAVIASSKRVPFSTDDIRDDRRNIQTGDKVILIIEDDPKFARILYDLVVERGLKGVMAGDGEAGLVLADMFVPDAVLLDISLPKMDGFTVLERLSSSPKTRHIPVHVVSATDSGRDAIRLGAIGFLSKPVSREKLMEVFDSIDEKLASSMKKLLIVEDDESLRTGIKALFSESNIMTSLASTAKEAEALIRSEEFEGMILDLGLPDESGVEFLERIRRDETIPYIPIVVHTGRELTEEEDQKLKTLAQSIVIKGAKSSERLLDEAALFLHKVQSDQPPSSKEEPAQAGHAGEVVLKGKKILIADDDMRNVFALSGVVESYGMQVFIAKNGKEALNSLDKHEDIDIVLMDIMMPEMDGFEAMREIRKQERLKKLPIIAITAKAMRGDRSACIEAGANDYLSKPVDIDKLMSLLRVWLYR